MAIAPALPFVPVEEYLKKHYEIACEYVDGVLVEKRVGSRIHGLLQLLLAQLLLANQQRYGVRVYIEQHIEIAPGRYRIPDVLVMAADHKREEILTQAPILTVEIVSRGEDWTDLTSKYKDHRRMGVETILIVDPYERTVFVVAEDGLLRQVGAPLALDVRMPTGTLRIDFDELFEQLD